MFRILVLFFLMANQVFAASIDLTGGGYGLELEDEKNESEQIREELESMMYGFAQPNILESPKFKSGKLIKEGLHFIRLGENKQGIKLLNKAWEKDPSNYKIGVYIGSLYIKQQDFTKALEIAEKLQNQYPENTLGYKLEGMVFAFQLDYEKAKVPFNKVLKLQPGTPDVSHNLARIAIYDQDIDLARNLYLDVLKYRPVFIPTLELLGELEMRNGEYDEVIDLLKRPVNNNPSEKKLILLLSRSYLAKGDYKNALISSNNGLKKTPEDYQLLETNGIALLNSGYPEKAVEVFKKAKPKITDNIRLHYYLAKSYLKINQIQNAKLEIDEALAIRPDFVLALTLKAKIYMRSNQPEKALKIIKKLQSNEPGNVQYIEYEAQIAIAEKRYDDAIELYEKISHLKESSLYTLQLGILNAKKGNREKTDNIYIGWLNKYPSDILIRTALAESLLVQGKLDQSKTQYEKIIRQNSKIFNAQAGLAYILETQGELDLAYVHAKKAYDLAPTNAQVVDTLATIYLKKGEPEKAIKVFNESLSKASNDPMLHYYFAKLLAETDDSVQAKNHLKAALNSKVPFNEKKQAIQLLKELQSTKK